MSDLPSAPQILRTCNSCGGKGYHAETIWVYEHGCGVSHPDVMESPCQYCNGEGVLIDEDEGDLHPPAD